MTARTASKSTREMCLIWPVLLGTYFSTFSTSSTFQLEQQLLRLFDVVERQIAGLDQMRHDRLAAAAEEGEELVDEAALRGGARDGRLEDVRVADLLRPTDGALLFEPVHHRLHGGVGRPALLGKGFENLADRGCATAPQRLHDLVFELAQFRQSHGVS